LNDYTIHSGSFSIRHDLTESYTSFGKLLSAIPGLCMKTRRTQSFNETWSFNEHTGHTAPFSAVSHVDTTAYRPQTQCGAKGRSTQPLAPQGFPDINKKVQQVDTLYQSAVLVLEKDCGNDRIVSGCSKCGCKGVHFNDSRHFCQLHYKSTNSMELDYSTAYRNRVFQHLFRFSLSLFVFRQYAFSADALESRQSLDNCRKNERSRNCVVHNFDPNLDLNTAFRPA